MVKSVLPRTVPGEVWKLADVDQDGLLGDEVFVLGKHLAKVKLKGHKVPADLPPCLISSSKQKHQ